MERKQAGWLTARRATTIFVIVSLGMTALQSLVFYHQWRREEENRRQEASQRLVVDLRTLLADLEDAESGERGFVITGTSKVLAQYEQSQKNVQADVKTVEQEGADQLVPQDLESLEQSASREMEELGKTVELRQKSGFDVAAAEVRSGRAQQLTEDLQKKVAALQAREEQALAVHTAEETRRIHTNTRMFVAVTAADVVLLALGYWGMQRYVADRKRTEAFLADARRQAEAATLAKDRVLNTVSHDLRTPLNGVMLWAEILKRGDPKNMEAAEAIGRYVEAQTRLVNDLLDASRMERGVLRVDKKPVLLGEALQRAIETLHLVAEDRRVHLETDVQLEGVQVMGDEFRLQQIFWNLISNGIKFTPPGGVVRVTGHSNGMAQVEVQDSGRGITPEFLPRVFDAYSQEMGSGGGAGGSGGAGRQGLGLGLAIVKQLVEAHGGKVEAHSDGEGRGARFVVRVPITGAESNNIHEVGVLTA